MMNKIIATFVKCQTIYTENQKYNPDYPQPLKLAGILGNCGYAMSQDLQGWISPDYEEELCKTLGKYLENIYGTGKVWKSVYISPKDLPEDEATQRLHQFCIYASPEFIDRIRENESGNSDFWETNNFKIEKVLGRSGDKELQDVLKGLMSSPIALGDLDYEILDSGLSWGIELKYPESIPCKEILCRVLSKGHGVEMISGVTDILRLVTYLSYKDASLRPGKRRIKLSNPQRKIVLGLLEDYLGKGELRFKLQDAKKYYGKWIIISQILHTPEAKYPRSFEFFSVLSGKDKAWMHGNWESRLQRAYDKAGKNGSLVGVIDVLALRPGEFIRHFDSVLRRAWAQKDEKGLSRLTEKFIEIQNTRPKTLLDLHRYYDRRGMEAQRSYVDKLGTRHLYGALEAIDGDLIGLAQGMIVGKLKKIWGEEKTLSGKKVYIDIQPGVELPLSLRSGVSDSTDVVLPGHKVWFEKTGMLRFFSQWIDPDGRQDLDIHGWLVSRDFEITRVSWNTHFFDESGSITHSGDVRHVQGNCAEYINVDFRKNPTYKYILILVQNFNSHKLSNIENYLGVSKVISEKIFNNGRWIPTENNTIFRTRVISDAKDIVGYLVNLEEGYIKFILEGIDFNSLYREGAVDVVKQYITEPSLDLRTLLSMYVTSKGGECIQELPEETDEEIMTIGTQDVLSGAVTEMLLG